ncbi:uncharacterized membrane protein At3g27390 isoform X2 [Phoenix dactylifera]|uniref:Uncharacterized membrane protein At3g27390 isoform X2 n=1 Tax=Phoenix dactylifera TaxID=42345 RepID=A0A8B7BIH5_PHODC|nr:uncharacterized membrane protein At3g27390 isoform X2 [Phoenix dactylifera]
MEVPIGFLAKLWSFISFLPFFFMLMILGILKAAVIGPVVAVIILVGNSAVIIGLWPAHFIWTHYCVIKTKRLGLVLKVLLLLCLPVPLLLWPVFGILGSLLVGTGYGYFTPLIATFEAVGEGVINKLYHCFANGCMGTIKGACTLVRDFTDFCFHSYFSFMDDLSEKIAEDEKPVDIELTKLPGCLLVCLLAVPIDVLMITGLALWKSPYMLLKGWQRLFEDLVGREGPFLETVCVPFAGLAILLWPLAVIGAVLAAFICSFFLGLFAGVIVYQENSLRMGLAYIVSIVSIFDEYANDLLYLREGSCLPRPKYQRAQVPTENIERKNQTEQNKNENEKVLSGVKRTRFASEGTKTLKKAIQDLRPIQIWDWLFRSCELNGRVLLAEGVIGLSDIEESIIQGNCKKLSIKLPAWCILQCLLRSAKSDSYGLLISDEVEVTNFNWPKDRVVDWILGPLLIMKEQIKRLQLDENEESCLMKLIMIRNNEKPEDWDDSGFPSDDNIRRAQLQAIFRRLQGIVANMSRIPSFRRRFSNLIKTLYLEAIENGTLRSSEADSKSRGKINRLIDSREKQNRRTESASASNRPMTVAALHDI